ncbi:MAG TPA: hypothetical protein VKW08_16465 [Xanthobacteraceae bacterium]|nr:hypothetical protein [Xanthobacteraceae bacterium]
MRVAKLIPVTTLIAVMIGAPACASPFDGTWSTTAECPREPGGGEGYTWRFLSTIRDGQLHGQYGTPGKPASATVEGLIENNGSGTLHVVGIAGDSKYNINNVPRGSPIDYQVSVRFEAARGSGERLSGRTCHYTFLRQ